VYVLESIGSKYVIVIVFDLYTMVRWEFERSESVPTESGGNLVAGSPSYLLS
jgi:hypothetical protein